MSWLAEHGHDPVPVDLIDLMSAVARMEQTLRDPEFKTHDLVHERIFTCDLPRLRGYLPPEAQAILDAEVHGEV